MKKTILFLTLLTLILTACSAAASPSQQTDTAQQATAIADIVSTTQTAVIPVATQAVTANNNSTTLNTNYADAAPVEMQLLVGIFKLESTTQAITSEQAKSLITHLTSLQGNNLTQDQITSVVEQMQAVLTADQIAAIAHMQITQESAMTIMQEQGLSMGAPGQGNGPGNGGQQPLQDGTLPQGTPPAQPDGQGQQPPAQPDGNAPQGQGAGMIPPPLLQALIQLLQSKVSS